MKYIKQKDGDWVQPIKNGYKMQCCDCGLVHTLNFKIAGKKIQFQAFRNYRSTGQVRRHIKSIRLIRRKK